MWIFDTISRTNPLQIEHRIVNEIDKTMSYHSKFKLKINGHFIDLIAGKKQQQQQNYTKSLWK